MPLHDSMPNGSFLSEMSLSKACKCDRSSEKACLNATGGDSGVSLSGPSILIGYAAAHVMYKKGILKKEYPECKKSILSNALSTSFWVYATKLL